MPSRVYSKVLGWGRLRNPVGPTFMHTVVPVGKVWVLRDADFIARTSSDLYMTMSIVHLAPPPVGASQLVQVFGYQGPGSSGGVPIQWRGRQVLDAGDILEVTMGSFSPPSQELDISISGYELTA